MVTTFFILLGLFIASGIIFLVALDKADNKIWRRIAIPSCIVAFLCWVGVLIVLWQTNFFMEPNLPIG